MILLDGKAVSAIIKEELKSEVEKLIDNGQRPPHLVAILVGVNPASQSYVKNKIKFCEYVGYKSTLLDLEETITEEYLLTKVQELNDDPNVDGFIVQLPLPKHIDEVKVNMAIDHHKDVDGFHPTNFGKMAQGMESYLPATPYGILEILTRYNIDTTGMHCVVVGRSNIVGTPMSILMSRKGNPGNCTVTLTHSRTKDIKAELLRADIIIAAIGIPGFVKEDMVKPGAIIIDVGINRVVSDATKSGYQLVGDVDFDKVKDKCSYITPVPGGVGPMTVAALMLNTMRSFRLSH